MSWDKVVVHGARKLRSRGKTYSEINSILGKNISKSIFNYWFKDIELPDSYYRKIKRINDQNRNESLKVAHKVNQEKLRVRLLGLRDKNKHLIHKIDKDVSKLLLAMLYLCEGAEYPSTRFLRFGSSHPGMIRLFIVLLRSCFNIDETKIRGELQCRADQDVNKLQKYWSNISEISLNMFYTARIDKRTIGKPTKKKDYKGVFCISYFDVDIQVEIQFLGEYLTEQGPVAQLAECLSGTEEVRGSIPLGSTK